MGGYLCQYTLQISGDVFDKGPSHAAGFDTSVCHQNNILPIAEQASFGNQGSSSIFGGNSINRQVMSTDEQQEVEEIPEISCCGSYPNRIPYHTNDTSRKCCLPASGTPNGLPKIYDSTFLECCDDGSTQVTCG